jgi:membrane protease YdiL (CAAX protease family)
MAFWIPYLGLAIFPIAAFAPFNLVRFFWGYHHGFEPMPHDVQERAETVDRYVWPLTNLLTIVPIVILMNHQSVPAALVGLRFDLWKLNAALGVSAGLFLVVIQGSLRMLMAPDKQGLDHAEHSRGPASLWCLIFLFGAFSEELWLAFCLVAFRQTNHSVAFSVLLTAIAIGLAHFPYRSGALATASLGAVSGMLFLWRGSLIPTYLFHFIGNIGALYWARRGTALTRRDGV